MVRQGNLAYDLSRYEYAAPKKEERPEIQARPHHHNVSGASTAHIVAGIMVLAALACFFLYCKAEQSQLYSSIAAETKRMEILSGENARMQTEIESRSSVKNVEDYAENVLGLCKLDQSQVEYVELPIDEMIVIPEEEDNFFVRLKNKFGEIVEYIMG